MTALHKEATHDLPLALHRCRRPDRHPSSYHHQPGLQLPSGLDGGAARPGGCLGYRALCNA
jgi:hypothetical protein